MASNTPFGFNEDEEDKVFNEFEFDYDFTDDEYLIPERPFIAELNTEDKNFEQE